MKRLHLVILVALTFSIGTAFAGQPRAGGGRGGQRPAKGQGGAQAPGGAAEGEEAEEEEGPTARILRDNDAVILRDGTRIDGTVLCAGQKGVTILTAGGEKTIPRSKVERVIRRADAGHPETFPIEERDGHKYVQDGSTAPAPGPKEPVIEIVAPAAPAAAPPAAPAAPAPRKPTPKTIRPKPLTPAKPVGPKPAQPKTPTVPKNPKIKLPEDLGGIDLPDDPAQVKALIKKLKKEGKLDQVLNDPKMRKAILDALRRKPKQ